MIKIQTKLISNSSMENFQNEVNKFFDESKIHLKDLLDIKYQHHNDKYTAMIIYQKYEDNIY